MFLSLNNAYQLNLPRLVNLRVTGFTKSIYEVEKDTGLILDTHEILKEIVECLKDRITAQVELEMYCLSLMDKQCHAGVEGETKQIIALFVETGNVIYRELIEHGLYKDNSLEFIYSNCIMDNLVFVEKSSVIKALNEELNTRYFHNPRSAESKRW